MSSTYSVLCLSHDPAIEIAGTEWSGGRQTTRTEAVALAMFPEQSDLLDSHAACDLLVGQYSYPLIEVCCPPTIRGIAKSCHLGDQNWHDDAEWWIRVEELRTFYMGSIPSPCWTPDRLRRLRVHLGMP